MDVIDGNVGKDQVRASSGPDRIDTGRYRNGFSNSDGVGGTVECGSGFDTVYYEKIAIR
jgi:hypothetical protein